MKYLIIVLLILSYSSLYAQSRGGKGNVQEVDFDGVDIDGKVRNPDGAYLLQKKGVDFLPLYNVRSEFDENIKESIEYLR